jgi:hypothetical protein
MSEVSQNCLPEQGVVRGVLRIATWANHQRVVYLAELAQLFICDNPEVVL